MEPKGYKYKERKNYNIPFVILLLLLLAGGVVLLNFNNGAVKDQIDNFGSIKIDIYQGDTLQ